MFFDYVLSKPVGFAVGLLYVAEASSSGFQSGSGGITELFTNYVAPIALVIYFLLRDEKRDRLTAKTEAERKRVETAKEETREKGTTDREERMAERIDDLENYINKTMLSSIAESKNSVTSLCQKIETLVSVIEKSDCPFINGGAEATGGHEKKHPRV